MNILVLIINKKMINNTPMLFILLFNKVYLNSDIKMKRKEEKKRKRKRKERNQRKENKEKEEKHQ